MSAFLALPLASVMAHTPVAEGCGASASEYAHELAVMKSTATSLNAPGGGQKAAMPLELERRYAISLQEQRKFKFRAAPGRTTRSAQARGGVFTFRTAVSGRYRVSLTSRHWVDLIDQGAMVESVGHFGPGCELAHKIVEFELPGGREITLQLSGSDDAIVGIAITGVPAERVAP